MPASSPLRRPTKAAAHYSGQIVSIDQEEPWEDEHDYLFAALDLGNALLALQQPRGYGVDPDAIYHTPDLPPESPDATSHTGQ